jgi:hypothetical protein
MSQSRAHNDVALASLPTLIGCWWDDSATRLNLSDGAVLCPVCC